MISNRYIRIFLSLMCSTFCRAAYDNRYFIWLKQPIERTNPSSVYADVAGLVIRSTQAYGDIDQEVGLYELTGNYDLNNLAQSLEAIGKPNPLKSEWRGQEIPWRLAGKLQAAGVRLSLLKDVYPHVAVGMDMQLLKVHTRQMFIFDQAHASITVQTCEERFELEQERLQAHQELGLTQAMWDTTSFGDLDCYLRIGNYWEYPYKFKAISVGLRLGALAPFARKQDIDNAASLPIAGNGHTGIYGGLDAEFELKDDLKVGLQTYLIQRLPRTGMFRVPYNKEPLIFGVITGQFTVSPRITFVASPYILWQDMHEGFGAGLGYTYITHEGGDYWRDARVDKSIEARLDQARRFSSWSAEYLSVYLRYDFARTTMMRSFAPAIECTIDAPICILGGRQFSQSVRVSLGVSF